MSLIGGPQGFGGYRAVSTVESASDKVEQLFHTGRLGSPVTVHKAAELNRALQTGLYHSAKVTELQVWATPKGYKSADVYLIGTHAFTKLVARSGASEWRDLGPVAQARPGLGG